MNDAPTTTAAPAKLAVALAFTPELQRQIQEGAESVELVTEAFTISSQPEANAAAERLTLCNKGVDALKLLKAGFVAPAKQIIANAEALFDPGIRGYEQSGTVLRQRLLGWKQQEDRRIAAENAAREAEARRARQEAEAKAARERAAAAELARQREREAAELEAQRRAAEEAGRTREAKALAGKAAEKTAQADAALENGERAAQNAHIEAQASTGAAPAVAAPIKGFTAAQNWVAERNEGVADDAAALELIVRAICGFPDEQRLARPDLLALFKLDTSALNRLAKAQKKLMNVPGYTAVDKPIARGSRGG